MASNIRRTYCFVKFEPMPKLSETEKAERRERVLDGARRCFAQYGYEGATVVRLEQEIGLSRGAIFNWFPSKEELFIALAARDNARLLLALRRGGPRGDPRRAAAGRSRLARRLPRVRPTAEDGRRAPRALEDDRSGGRRERSRGWIEAGQAAKDACARTSRPSEIGQFLGVILDGIAVQRALGFDAPEPRAAPSADA